MRTIKNLLSCCVLLVFFIMGVASTATGPGVRFEYNRKTETDPVNKIFLVKNDDSRVYGKEVRWKSGLLVKDQIRIDDEAFKIKEIKGYFENGTYYGRLGNTYIQRVLHRKINVYLTYRQYTTTSTDHGGFTHTSTRTIAVYYYQRGEDGELIVLPDINTIRTVMSDCPAALQMLDMSKSKLRKTMRKQHDYLNTVFEVYNNNCRSVKERSTE